ncbi:MAG: Asp-tRNA(Asn)/Glu-tRNA(Gln) amidotransferase subunit GatC [Candidatus Pacebacteria bacterium]|nr:Asp-tRNA(Asn)/Glu-tRNA(Gln) amidotransferase subunit GatC [Candidatus Paceibacterota bacterium]
MADDIKISIEEVEHIAELARIELSVKEVEKFAGELSDVLGYIEQLKEADTKGVKLVSQVTGLVNVLRDDVVNSSDEDTRNTMIDNFPDKDGEYIKVKQVM